MKLPSGRRIAIAILAAQMLLAAVAGRAAPGQELPPPAVPEGSAAFVVGPGVGGPGNALAAEARRYLQDAKGFVLAPTRWSGGSWAEAAGVVAAVGILAKEDVRIDAAVQRNRSPGTNSVSRAVTPFGSYAAVGASAASLAAGLIFKDERLRDIGRDSVEAEIFAAGIVTPLLKSAFGRSRPVNGGDGDEYRPFSNGQSFPSGHTTEAFAVASVFAARSSGWVVPVLAYSLATGVGLARMNDRAHFASDVAAGAVIGTVIGRTIVHRHSGESFRRLSWNVVPVRGERRGGVGLGLRLSTGSAAE
ncbi:MAG: phosphatase PAP2 family protein [Acidobacteriota bacterium]